MLATDWASALWLQQHFESAFFWDTLYMVQKSKCRNTASQSSKVTWDAEQVSEQRRHFPSSVPEELTWTKQKMVLSKLAVQSADNWATGLHRVLYGVWGLVRDRAVWKRILRLKLANVIVYIFYVYTYIHIFCVVSRDWCNLKICLVSPPYDLESFLFFWLWTPTRASQFFGAVCQQESTAKSKIGG